MKTFLFITALAFNIGLCFYPFPHHTENLVNSPKNTSLMDISPSEESDGLAYSDFLKGKAALLPEQ